MRVTVPMARFLLKGSIMPQITAGRVVALGFLFGMAFSLGAAVVNYPFSVGWTIAWQGYRLVSAPALLQLQHSAEHR